MYGKTTVNGKRQIHMYDELTMLLNKKLIVLMVSLPKTVLQKYLTILDFAADRSRTNIGLKAHREWKNLAIEMFLEISLSI